MVRFFFFLIALEEQNYVQALTWRIRSLGSGVSDTGILRHSFKHT